MEHTNEKEIRCGVCHTEFYKNEIPQGLFNGCPICHTRVPLLDKRQDFFIKMNWQHLRMLAIYAQRWAAQLDRQEPFVEDSIKVIEAIVKDIEKMKPQNALTARDEIAMKIREETDKPKPIPSPYFFRKT